MVAHRKEIGARILEFSEYIYRRSQTVNTVLGIDYTAIDGIIPEESGHYRTERPSTGATYYIANKAYSHRITFLIIYFKSITQDLMTNKKDPQPYKG
jgi:hypothetical protein